tara:strand:- start:1764 stop:1928 length:165 start_codon:yes stop_codon:yes gene_type:complete
MSNAIAAAILTFATIYREQEPPEHQNKKAKEEVLSIFHDIKSQLNECPSNDEAT